MGKISWTGRTWNPIRGCSEVSPGCGRCYARDIAGRFSGPGLPYEGYAVMRRGRAEWTGDLGLVDDKVHDPIGWRPSLVFVNSMSDLGHEALPDTLRDSVFRTMAMSQQCVFQVLTKRPEVLRPYLDRAAARVREEFLESRQEDMDSRRGRKLYAPTADHPGGGGRVWPGWPLPNVWIGVSAESQRYWDERVPELLQMKAALRFVSMEPLLGPIAADQLLDRLHVGRGIDWGIVGGESDDRDARPCDQAWFADIVRAFGAARVPLWAKQLGSHPAASPQGRPLSRDELGQPLYRIRVTDKGGKGEDLDDFPPALRVRQMPKAWTERVHPA